MIFIDTEVLLRLPPISCLIVNPDLQNILTKNDLKTGLHNVLRPYIFTGFSTLVSRPTKKYFVSVIFKIGIKIELPFSVLQNTLYPLRKFNRVAKPISTNI